MNEVSLAEVDKGRKEGGGEGEGGFFDLLPNWAGWLRCPIVALFCSSFLFHIVFDLQTSLFCLT